jgi:hypothetical protein
VDQQQSRLYVGGLIDAVDFHVYLGRRLNASFRTGECQLYRSRREHANKVLFVGG